MSNSAHKSLTALNQAVNNAQLASRKNSAAANLARGSLSVQGNSTNATKSNSSKAVEEEYIRNLQQQIYLLELETRYLKKGPNSSNQPKAKDISDSTSVSVSDSSAVTLNEAFKSLKGKYIELQDSNKEKVKKLEQKLEQLGEQLKLSQLAQEALEKEKAELERDNKALSSQSINAEDKVFNEIATLSKRLEVSQAEAARLELSYNRVLQEKERLQASTLQSNLEAAKYRDQVEEQLTVHNNLTRKVDDLQKTNASLKIQLEDQQAAILSLDVDTFKARIKELQQDKINLQTEVKQMESIRSQQDQLHKRMNADYNDLVKTNVTLQAELDETRKRLKHETERSEEKFRRRQDDIKVGESNKDELGSLRDSASINKIAIEARDRKINLLQTQLQDQEVSLNKALETRAVLEDRLLTCENRLKKLDSDQIELVKDKTLLASQVTQLQHQVDQNNRKLTETRRQRDSYQVELEKYQRQNRARSELGVLLKQIEQSGQNYMNLMQSVRSFVNDDGPSPFPAKDPDQLSRDPSQSFIPPPIEPQQKLNSRYSTQQKHKDQLQRLVAELSGQDNISSTSLDDFILSASEVEK